MLKREISKREMAEKLAFSLVWHIHEREKRDKYEVGPTCFFFSPGQRRKAWEVAYLVIFTFLPFSCTPKLLLFYNLHVTFFAWVHLININKPLIILLIKLKLSKNKIIQFNN